jgi:sialate O-acetylesterase
MPYTSAGVIWYQGEADTDRAEIYDKMFGEMIRCWREGWGENQPFLFVQLAPFGYFALSNGNSFVPIRAMQEKVSKTVQNTYMACIMDAGMEYDIHPKQKRPVGERLALLALGKVYGRDIICESPEAISISKGSGSLSVLFGNVGDGFRVNGDKVNSLELFIDGVPIEYFEAEACGSKLNIRCPLITDEASVELRLAWVGYCEINLYSSAGLPAKPFVLLT